MTRPSDDEIKRLRASEEKYRQMMQRANDAIFAIHPESGAILEVNPKHAFIEKLRVLHAADPKSEDLGRYARLLYGQAILAEGGRLPDPASFSKMVMDVLVKATQATA